MARQKSFYTTAAFCAVLLALAVMMLGAYTRLTDAGLGCPDWPGCYGKLVLSKSDPALSTAVISKAWTEMSHRYLAGLLAIVILGLAFGARRIFPWVIVGLVILQATFGMWTVTWKLLPIVVMGHLLGGMILVTCLWWLFLSSRPTQIELSDNYSKILPWAVFGSILIFMQIALGGWTTANYAALACPTFPFCNGTLFPNLDLKSAFNFFSPIGPNYEFGQLTMAARMTIQMMHRYGAFLTADYLILFTVFLIANKNFRGLRGLSVLLLALLLIQFNLGVINVQLQLPLWSALLHNITAAFLLLTIVTIIYKVTLKTKEMR